MKPILIIGTSIVNLALIAYSIGVLSEQKNKIVSLFSISFITTGVVFDIIATVCMIMGSTHTALSSHGLFGYSALLLMLIDCILLWKYRILKGTAEKVSKSLHLYSRFAYIWWVVAYLTGAVLIAIRHLK
jgi:uncharacterized repeat protein (TIGR03987 family)